MSVQGGKSDGCISPVLQKTLMKIRRAFGDSGDLNIARFEMSGIKCAVVTLEAMVSSADLSKMLFEPLMNYQKKRADSREIFDFLSRKGIFSVESEEINKIGQIAEKLCSGFAVVLVDGCRLAMAYSAQGFKTKSITDPSTEANVKGTGEALSDNLRTSMSLIRRRIKSPDLRFEFMTAGRLSNTELCLVYIKGRTPENLRKLIKSRLKKIRLDLILTSGSVLPFMSENGGAFFSEVSTTERPDVAASKISEGRIAVLIDGVPYAAICPTLFIENFQTVDDYEEKPYYALCQRWIRYIAFFIASFLPGLYVACATHHPEVLSRALLINLISSEESTPFPLIAEMFIVIIMFEILKEAGLRLPKDVGGAVSIVGGLVIGDAAVTSGLISAPLLIIIGITATSSFVIPSLNSQTAVLRLVSVAVGGALGLFGLGIFMTVILANAAATDCYAVPYTAPMAPFTLRAMRDVLTRVGFKRMQKRSETVEELNGSGGENAER